LFNNLGYRNPAELRERCMITKYTTLSRAVALLTSASLTAGFILAQEALKATVSGTLEGHTAAVYSAAYTPDGKNIVTGSFDSTVKIWDASTRKAIKTLEGHTGLVLSVALDPAGKRIVTGSLDKSARIWDMPGTLAPTKSIADSARINAFALKPDGKAALTASGKTITLWNLADGKATKTVIAASEVESLNWKADSSQFAAGLKGGTIQLYNGPDAALQSQIAQPADTVLGLAYLPNGQGLISAGSDGVARLWSLPFPVATIADTKADSFAISSDATRIAVVAGTSIRVLGSNNMATIGEIKGLKATPTFVALNSNGTRVAAVSADKSIRLYNVADGKEIRTIANIPATVVALSLQSTGNQVAVASDDHSIRVYGVGDGKLVKELKGHAGRIHSLTFVPTNADKLISAGADKIAKIWSLSTGKFTDLTGHTDTITSITLDRAGKTIATGSLDKSTRLWNLEKATLIGTTIAHPAAVTDLGFSVDGSQLATVTAGGEARVFQTQNGHPIQVLAAQGTGLKGVIFVPGTKAIALLGSREGKSFTTWTPNAVRTFEGHTGPINALAVTPNGAQVITASSDKSVRVFDVASGKQVRELPGHTDAIRAVAISKDGQTIATAGSDKVARTWNAADGKLKLAYPQAAALQSLAFTTDAKGLAIGLADGSTKVLDLTATDVTKADRQVIPGKSAINALAISADGGSLISVEDKLVQLWPLSAGTSRPLNGHTSQVYCVGWSADGNLIVTGAGDASVRLWDATKGTQTKSIEKAHAASVYAALLHPKGDLIITAGDDKLIKYWNPVDGKEVRKSTGHGAAVYCLAFRPGHAMIASGSVDKTVRLWNVADGKEVRIFSGHPDDVYALAFTPDGKRLASIGYGGNLFLWDVETGKALLQQKVNPRTICFGLAMSPDGKKVAVTGSDDKAYILDLP
jgi:WD40 repeat protein